MRKMSGSAQGSFIVLIVLGLFTWRCACQSDCRTPLSITVTPSTNQTVPINTDTSVTYRCQVTNGLRADWTFMGIPIPIGSANHALLGSLGVNISAGASQSDIYLTVDRNGRETYSNRDLKIVCTELITTPVLMIQTSCDYFIRTVESQIIIVSPTGNQTVPAGSDVNVTYTCYVPAGFIVEWVFGEVQLSPGSSNEQLLAQNGIILDPPTEGRMTNIIVTRLGRETFGSNIQLRCSALQQSPVRIVFGDSYYVRTFDIPGPPENFAFNPIPTDTTRLVLSWDQPGNTLIDEDDPVTTTYTVTVSGPTFNFNVTTTDTSYEFTDELNEACATHDIFVSASNAAGQGMNVTRQETIPITPDIRDLSSSLRVSRINLSGGGVAVDVTFNPATICSDMNFPLVSYMVNVAIGNEMDSMTYLVTDSRIVGQSPITLPVPSGMLRQDEGYQVTVSACITVTCRTTLVPVLFRTTNVQSASITFFETNVFLECTFVEMIAGLGCAFRLTVASGDVETIFVPVSAGSMCSMTQNMQNAYTSIEAVDWESDMVFGMATTRVTINSAGADNYTMVTGCVPPTPAASLSDGAIAGITIGVILAVLVILAIVIVITVVVYKRQASKQPKIMRHDEEKVSVDFDKQWLMADHELPKKKTSFRRGRSLVDGTEELAQPSLTDSTAAFSLHISRDKKKAHLHLNRALIRRALKERRMTTLDKKSARARPTQSIREFLLPLHSEIRVTGEESDEDVQIDGEDEGDAKKVTPQTETEMILQPAIYEELRDIKPDPNTRENVAYGHMQPLRQ